MDVEKLRIWLAQPRLELVTAVAEGVRDHVTSLRSRGIDFYGYALLPGEPYDIRNLVAVSNGEADIKVPPTDSQYIYHRFCVDEWSTWDHDEFAAANARLAEANETFAAMHKKEGSDFRMDEHESAHAQALLEAVVRGLEVAKADGAFGSVEPFLAVWISDSGHPIIAGSVRQLNSEAVAEQFMEEFG
jgi:hypothetical protein